MQPGQFLIDNDTYHYFEKVAQMVGVDVGEVLFIEFLKNNI